MENNNIPKILKFFFIVVICTLLILIGCMIQATAQTPQLDSLEKAYIRATRIYDSARKSNIQYLRQGKDTAKFWDNQAFIKEALARCASIDAILQHRREDWLKQRGKELYKN